MSKLVFFLLGLVFLSSCKRSVDVVYQDFDWPLFNNPAAIKTNALTRSKLEGIYTVEGSTFFGPELAAHWSYEINGSDTVYKLSLFGSEQGAYIVCEGKRLDTSLLLKGYYRRALTTQAGQVQLSVTQSGGSAYLFNNNPVDTTQNITISGLFFGTIQGPADITLSYDRPLHPLNNFQVLAHRGGGRTSDLLPASENSVEMILLASSFGATGIEIDIQLTKDKVPILYHDATLNERVIIKNGMVGPVEDYNWDQLKALVRLKRGGRIPTLREALEAAVYRTPLRFVWLDIKYDGDLSAIRQLQTEFIQASNAIGKPMQIVIGLPDEAAFKNFKKLNNYQQVPSLCELSTAQAVEINARVWAPTWTQGLQTDAVQTMQAQGRSVFTWTMDVPANIRQYLYDGSFNGILSNYPSLVAYYYYAQP